METIEKVEIGQQQGADRWLRIEIDREGGCSITLVGEGFESKHPYPCSLETLRLISTGMSYQASSTEGYLTVTYSHGCIHLYARTADDRKTWTHTMKASEFAERIRPLTEAAIDRRKGYVA